MNTYIEGMRDALTRIGWMRSSSSSWMTGFCVGAGVGLVSGAVVAILVTPTNGREMRRELGTRAKHLAKQTQQLAERTQHRLQHVAEDVKGRLETEANRRHGRNEVPVG
jgi:gas vesicle protein